MRRTAWTCDGCGKVASVEEGSKPTNWASMTIRIEGYTNWAMGGKPEPVMIRDLCGSCQMRLQRDADPKWWPRDAAKGDPA